MREIKLQKILLNSLDKLRKLYMLGNGHLEIFSLFFRKFFSLQTDSLQKTVVGSPCFFFGCLPDACCVQPEASANGSSLLTNISPGVFVVVGQFFHWFKFYFRL